jgi:hypothetical protein
VARSLNILISGLLLAGAVVLLLVWWIGPGMVNLALFDAQRNQPYTHLEFARGVEDEVFRARYEVPLAGLVASEQGVLVDSFELVHLLHGRTEDEWQSLSRLHMNQAKDLVQVMTSSPYRLMQQVDADLEVRALGSFAPPVDNWRPVLVVMLGQTPATALLDPLAPMTSLLALGSGRLAWDASLTAFHSDARWDRMVVLDFADTQQALAWLRHADVSTARALSNARCNNLTVAVYQRRGF